MKIPGTMILACLCAALQLVAVQARAQSATDVACTGCVGTGDIANNAVNSTKIADGSIKSSDLGTNAVTATKIKNSSITFNKLSAGLKNQVNSSLAALTFQGSLAEDVGFAAAECPDDRFSVAASCGCSNNDGANNLGVLNLCATIGTGAIASCLYEAITMDDQLPPPVAQVEAVCLGATAVDGTPWVPIPDGVAPFDAESAHAAQSVEQTAKWRKDQKAAFDAAVVEHRRKFADYQRRIPSR